MGAKYVGDIKELCDIVHPKHGIITSIGPQHLESFKSLQNVINTKFELADALPKDGMLFLNGDNEYIAERAPDGAITYGLNSDSKYKAKLISVGDKGTTFEVTTPDGEKEEFTTKLIGTHNCLNILGAIAVSHELGISLAELRPQVRRLESVATSRRNTTANSAEMPPQSATMLPSSARGRRRAYTKVLSRQALTSRTYLCLPRSAMRSQRSAR